MSINRYEILLKILEWLKSDGTSLDVILDEKLKNFSLSEREHILEYFRTVIDQPAFNSEDHKRLRRLLVDWYAANRILVSELKNLNDPFNLPTESLNKLIRSFGFPYPERITSTTLKARFILDLVDLYKTKGTPQTLVKVLQTYFGLSNIILTEWWLHADNSVTPTAFYAQSKVVYPRNLSDRPDLAVQIPFSNLVEGDPLWRMTEDEIRQLYLTEKITLPSITPYFSLQSQLRTLDAEIPYYIMVKKIEEEYDFWQEYVLTWRPDVKGIRSDPPQFPGLGDRYIIGQNPTGAWSGRENQIAIWGGSSWDYELPDDNYCVLNLEDSKPYVFSYDGWYTFLPTKSIDELKAASNKIGSLNKIVTLSKFDGLYSILELFLAIFYLFNAKRYDVAKRFKQYQGTLDQENSLGIRDDIDDVDYQIIIDEYNNITKRPISRDDRDERYRLREERFTASVQDKATFFNVLEQAGQTLLAINAHFRKEIDRLKEELISGEHEVLESLLLDLESLMTNSLQIQKVPAISTITLGLSLWDKIKDIIDFFKPYRSRVKDFVISYLLSDPVGDSQLEKDHIYATLSMLLRDHGPWELDQGMAKDKLLMTIAQDLLSRYDRFDSDVVDHMLLAINQITKELIRREDEFVSAVNQFIQEYGPYGLDSSMATDMILFTIWHKTREYYGNSLDMNFNDFFLHAPNQIVKELCRQEDQMRILFKTTWYEHGPFGLDSSQAEDGLIVAPNLLFTEALTRLDQKIKDGFDLTPHLILKEFCTIVEEALSEIIRMTFSISNNRSDGKLDNAIVEDTFIVGIHIPITYDFESLDNYMKDDIFFRIYCDYELNAKPIEEFTMKVRIPFYEVNPHTTFDQGLVVDSFSLNLNEVMTERLNTTMLDQIGVFDQFFVQVVDL